MPEQPSHRLPEEFGGNEWLVDELYERYQQDKNTVDAKWWPLFESFEASDGSSTNGATAPAAAHPTTRELPVVAPAASAQAAPAAPAPAAPAAPAAAPAAAAPAPAASKAPATVARDGAKTAEPGAGTQPIPAQLPKNVKAPTAPEEDVVSVLRGPAKAIAANMVTSLEIPTATSVRAIPAKLLIDNRVVINSNLARARGGKVSFTHLIGYAVIRALAQFPSMNVYYDGVDGKPSAVQPAHVNFGIAIDMPKPDGTRLLMVPNIKKAETLNFSEFWHTYEDLIKRARNGKLTADDHAGTTVSLTNPGGIGTVHSVPRLSKGQAAIIGVGALDYPAEFQGASEKIIAQNAISKVLTLTSTYDHRVIQGAGSGEFLKLVHQLLLGAQGFYDEIFESLRIPYEPVRWSPDLQVDPADEINKVARIQQLIHSYRVRGHLMADTDPLEYVQRKHPDLDVLTYGLTLWDLDREWPTGGFGGKPMLKFRDILGVLRDAYCRTTGIEYMHIQDPAERKWFQDQLEHPYPPSRDEQLRIVSRLNAAEAFETFLQTVCRPEALLPRGRRVADPAPGRHHLRRCRRRPRRGCDRHGPPRPPERADQHRRQDLRPGLPRVRGHPGSPLRAGLRRREVPPRHRGYLHLGQRQADQGLPRRQPLAPRGRGLRARGHRPRQTGPPRPGRDLPRAADHGPRRRGLRRPGRRRGDPEPLPAARLPHRRHHPRGGQQPGRLHHRAVVLAVLHHSTDVAKMIQAPVFHVNGDDPEAVVRIGQLAYEFRQRFHKDVVIDMVCYRRRGHNEGDDPSMTQPLMYNLIEAKRSVRKLYTESLIGRGDITEEEAEQLLRDYQERLERVFAETHAAQTSPIPVITADTGAVSDLELPSAQQSDTGSGAPESTAISAETLARIGKAHIEYPEGFTVHAKLKQLLEKREVMSREGGIDWGFGELAAFGSLTMEGVPVRLAGQDSRRGTFVQRHAVFHDRANGDEWTPLANLTEDQAKLWIYDSLLSEYAAMGFEYGYSVERPDALVLWEAQFGDFVNGAQTIIDEFISSAEQKWGQRSSLVLMLPHGYEGQGPDHSSARIERFLQLCAEENMIVANPTTPASHFHLLRRQAYSRPRKPLIIFTPKQLLRLKAAASSVEDFTSGAFRPVIPEHEQLQADAVERVLLVSGRLYYDLLSTRQKTGDTTTAIVRVEQLYPLPAEEIAAELAKYPNAEVVWAQDEPANQGPWPFIGLNLPDALDRRVRLVSRPASASTAAGSMKRHAAEQDTLLKQAFARK